MFFTNRWNDIVNGSVASKIAKDIVSLASYLHEGIGVRRVIIGQLLCRRPYAACSDFNGTVLEINRVLREMRSGLKGIVFWPHLGFGNSLSYLGPDGVHIQCTSSNDQPMRKFLHSYHHFIGLRPVLVTILSSYPTSLELYKCNLCTLCSYMLYSILIMKRGEFQSVYSFGVAIPYEALQNR